MKQRNSELWGLKRKMQARIQGEFKPERMVALELPVSRHEKI
jgi:hypothetical protein